MNGYPDWIIDISDPPKPQDQVEEEVEEDKIVEQECI